MSSEKVLVSAVSGGVCVLILVSMLLLHAQPLWTGESVYLEVRPVDPRDVFRGDYVILSYPVQRIDTRGVEQIGDGWDDLKRGQLIYVQLVAVPCETEGVPEQHVVRSVSRALVEDAINLRGRVRSLGSDLTLQYGIDAFFVQEGEGKPIETALRGSEPVYAEIAVTRSGRARVKNLIIEGRGVARD